MPRLVQFTADQPEWLPSYGFLAPGQHVDVDEETAKTLAKRPDFAERDTPGPPGPPPVPPPDVPGVRP